MSGRKGETKLMDKHRLIQLAVEARENAYVPYSQFKVGSALIDNNGNVHKGCNVENAAYGPTNCAERTALFRAIADGAPPGKFRAIAVVGDTPQPITPCGVCRQVLIELCAPDMPVYMANLRGDITESTVAELLPGAFTKNELNGGTIIHDSSSQ
jgi:cytidine deaminase